MSESFEPETGEMIVKRVSVPIGLEELMEGLTKEVLLKKPDDIYLFAADYFSRLLLLRDKGSYRAKPLKNAQSVAKQTPKQPIEKLLVRGASKQLSRQISIRSESPIKKVAPVKRPPARMGKENAERNKFVDRRKMKRSEGVETKTTESKSKQVLTTPRHIQEVNEEKVKTINKRDRSLSTARRGRSSSRNAQVTPRQKDIPISGKVEMSSENEKHGKVSVRSGDKHKSEKEKPVISQISSIEETEEYIKDGKLTVTPPKIIKRPQAADSQEVISSLIVPQVVSHIASFTDNNDPHINHENVKVKSVEGTIKIVNDKITNEQSEINDNEINKLLVGKDIAGNTITEDHNLTKNEEKANSETKDDKVIKEEQDIGEGSADNINVEEVKKNLKSSTNNDEKEDKHSDTDEMKTSIVSDTQESVEEESKSDENCKETYLEDLKHEVEKSEFSKKETKEKIENLPEDGKETSSRLKSEIQDQIEIMEKQQTNEKMFKNNELEASAEADKNLIPVFQNNAELEAKNQKERNFAETDYASSDSYKFQLEEGNSNQQNKSEIEKEKENGKIINGEKQEKTSDRGKEFEERKTNEIINGTKNEKTEQVSTASLDKTKPFEEVTIDETLNVTSNKEISDNLLNKEPKNINERDSKTYNEFKIENKQISKDEEKLEEFNRDSDDKSEIKDEKLYTEIPIVKDEDNKKTHTEKSSEERKIIFKSDNVLKEDEALSSEEKLDNEKSIKEEIKNVLEKDGILCSEEKTDTEESLAEESNNILKKVERVGDPEKPPEERKNVFKNDIVLKKGDALSSEEKSDNEKPIKEEIKSVFKKDDPLSTEESLGKESKNVLEKDDKSSDEITETDESVGEVGKSILNQDDDTSSEENTDSKKSGRDESNNKLIEKSNIILNRDDVVSGSEGKLHTEKLIEEKSKNILKIEDTKSSEEKPNSKESSEDEIDEKLREEKSDSVLNKEDKANTEKSTAGEDKHILKRSNALSTEEDTDTIMSTKETEPILKKESVLSNEEKTDTKGLIIEQSKDIINSDDVLSSEEKVDIEKSVAQETKSVFKSDEGISGGKETIIKESTEEESKNRDKVLSNEEKIGIEKPIVEESRNVLKSDHLGTEEKTDMFTDESKDAALNIEEETDTKKIIAEKSEDVSKKDYDSIRNEVYMQTPTEEQSKNVFEKDDSLSEEVINVEKPLNEENKHVLNKNISNSKEKIDIEKPTQESSNVYDTLTIEDNKKIDTENTSVPDISDHVHKIVIAENITKQTSDNAASKSKVNSTLKDNSTGESDKEKGISGDLTENSYLREQTKPDASDFNRTDGSNISLLDKSESQRSEGSDKNTQDHKADGRLENNEIKRSISSESKANLSTDICSSSTAESITNSNNKETSTSSTNTTNKESDDTLDSETEESTQKKHIESLIDQEAEIEITKENDSNLERDKEQHVTHELKNTSQSSKNNFLDNAKNSMYNAIKSVLNISEGGLMDHDVKTHIGDFIQSEKQHVFVGTSNITSDPNLGEKYAQKCLKKDQLENFPTNENLSNQKKKADDSLIREEKVAESELQSQDNESNNKDIINSVIKIVNDGSVDHKVKTFINNFIQKETQHVFVEKPVRISGTKAATSKEIDPVPLKKELLKHLSVAESNSDDTSDSIVSETQSGQVDDLDKTYIYDFLREEKQNTFKHDINANKDFKMALEIENKTESSILTTEIKLKGTEESPEQKKKFNEERKIKRVKSVDVIRDESKNKIQVKSRIPTADYRSRVKRDESGKHSIRIKRSSSHHDNVKVSDTDDTVTAVEKYESSLHKKREIPDDINSSNVIEDRKKNDKEITEPIKEKSQVALKSTSDVGTKQICEVSSEQNNGVKSDKEVNIKSNLDTPKLHQELKDVKDEADALQNVVKSDIALKEIVAVIKIQSWWRGYRARKNKINVLDKQSTNKPLQNREFCANDSNTDIKQMVEYSDRQNENRLEKAAVAIQKNWRDFMVRKRPLSGNPKIVGNEEIKVQKDAKEMLEEDANNTESTKALDDSNEIFVKAAVTIQKIWRGFKVRQVVVNTSKEKTDLLVLREKDLKSKVPKENTQNAVEKLTEQKLMSPLKSEEELTKAAIVIQKNWRELKTNPKSKSIKNITREVPKLESTKQTITNIGSINIAHSQSTIQNEDEFIKAATLIQKIWRGFNARKLYKDHSKQNTNNKQKTESPDNGIINPKSNVLEQEKNNKTIIEGTTENKSEKLQLPLKSEDEFTKAAILIQKNWRGFKVRNLSKEGFKLKSSVEPKKIDPKEQSISGQVLTNASQPVTQQSDAEFFKAATVIQKNWRGFNVRKLYKHKLKQTDSKKLTEPLTSVHGNDSKSDSLKEEITVVEESTPPQKSAKLNISAESEDGLTKAALLIQKNWKGFKVRNAQKNNFNPRSGTEHASAEQLRNIITEEPTVIKQVKTQIFQEPSLLNLKVGDDFVKAAVMIQKIWRGFKVRKYLSRNQEQKKGNSDKSDSVLETPVETKLLGKPVENEKLEIETIKEADPKDRKSALKIQSLWRGYQVRKNINVIKNKLEDTFTTNDTGKGKELTDGDILNAATKIQAGVRGYLQRKKYKTDISKLNSISEEDYDDKHLKLIPDHRKEHDGNVIVDEGKLSEEVLKALEDLNKLEVPNDIPILHETDKPKFYRSNTVQEPEIVRKQNPQLYKYISVDAPNLLNIDNNNNPNKVKESSPLEIKVKTTTHDGQGCNQYKLTSDEKLKEEMSENDLFFENSTANINNVQQNLNNDGKKEDFSSQSRLGSISENSQLRDYEGTDTRSLISDENLVDISTNEENKIIQLHPSVAERSTDEVKTGVDQNFPHNQEIDNTTTCNDNIEDRQEKNTYERPLSMDSNDSAVTVIYKEIPDTSKNSLENSSISDKVFETEDKPNEALSEHENLINDFQNKLLDQISGKNGSVEETVNKFDIEQLRKEFEEAGLIYNADDNNIRHENSREIIDDHDQLLDYLEGFELSTEKGQDSSHLKDPNPNLLSRDLPDIKEEDLESKSITNNLQQINRKLSPEKGQDIKGKEQQSVVPNGVRINEDMQENDLNIEKIKSTLKECEDIAREINKGFEAIKDDEITKPESNCKSIESISEMKDTVSNEPEQLFCGTTGEQREHKMIPKDVEILTPVNSKEGNTLKITFNDNQNKSIESSSNQSIDEASKSTPLNRLLHTGELHDSVIVPFLKESDLKSENKGVELSTKDISEIQNSKLLHTGELHDTVVIPLPIRAQNNLEIDTEKQPNNARLEITAEVPLSSSTPDTNMKVQNIKHDGSNVPIQGLLHTGELHDVLLTPLLIEAQNSLAENHDNLTKSLENDLAESVQKPISEVPINNQQTGLLHTGELHDPVVLPLPKDKPDTNTEDRGAAEDNKEHTGDSENSPRQVDSESQTTGDPSIAVQLSDVPAGVEALTSPRPVLVVADVNGVAVRPAQTPDKGALPNASSSDLSSPSDLQSMESEKRTNATINNKSMEVEAATKIQAGFRGYQVRKQLKLKNGSSDINNQRRQLRRKSSGRLAEANRITQNKPSDIEEKSAVKIQAGVRGFLVRRRQKKLKNQES